MVADKMADLYTQLVCPSNFFSNEEIVSVDPIREKVVEPQQNGDESISLLVSLGNKISYVGLKVKDEKGE